MRKRKLLFPLILFPLSILSAENLHLNDYLKGWIENDRDLKSAVLSLQKTELSNEKTLIQNGFDITLSSGTMILKTGNDGVSFSLNPTVNASLPSMRNLSLSAGSSINVSANSEVTNASLKAEIDLLDTEKEKRSLTEKKALRSVLEAKRNIEAKAQSSEKDFYSEIKSLLKSSESISNSETSLYTDKISFEKIKTQGFAETSSSYRLAEMKVNNDLHTIETTERSLNHNFGLFLIKCGFQEDSITYDDFLKLLEAELTEPELLTFESFNKENYKTLENALWTQELNTLTREADKNYNLKGNAGYTFRNSTTNDSDSIDVGLSSSVLGMTLKGGISLPVNPAASPSFTAAISFSPNTLKLQKLEEKENQLSVQSESLSVETALNAYNLALADNRQTLKDLEWTKSTNEENLAMYTKTESDMKYYFDCGIITESEYLSAKANKEKYEIEKTLGILDVIITNCETQNLFYTE